MAGYALEIKRNYDCSTSLDLKKLVLLGYVDTTNMHEPTSKAFIREYTAKSMLERYATSSPPPRGQNIRAPVDSVDTKPCQEWVTEFLALLANKNITDAKAVGIAQEERDAPTHGILVTSNRMKTRTRTGTHDED
ncbi:MAG: hypothetical protein M1818_002475 [Claussenomyces sp. TS43310]|nr:MAG: hypothetical protein M1818_002475 [Claussenomyces sp. TS43310]